jgi:hypothetical protein
MCFELIPNELLFDLFEYLSSVDLFHAFNGLNIRFDNLLIEYFQVRKSIDFRLIYKEDLNLIRQRYLPVVINEITSICLSDEDTNPNEIDLFISRLFPLHRFVNLQSITFYQIYSAEKINRILTDLQRISHLTVLNFHQCQFEYDLKRFLIIMNGIWSLSNLTHCSLDLFGGFYRDLISPTIISCSIQNLSIKGLKCGLEVLSLLYDHTPSLQNLSIEGSQSDDDYQSLPIMYLLNTLTLKCENSSRLFIPILRKVPNLTKLTIETTKIEMNGQQWENILRKYLPNLKIFDLKMKYEVIDVENIEDQIDHILDSYRTQFWIDEHKWFVRCFSTTGNHGNSINIHTLPYRFKEISLSINDTENYIFRSTCPNNDHYLVYNYVQNLDCCCNTSEEINLSQIQFPNVEYLTLKLPYDDYFRCLVPQFDKLISLNIHMFDMGADDNQLLQLQLLLDQAPRLYYLKFETWSSVLSKAGSKNKKVRASWKINICS